MNPRLFLLLCAAAVLLALLLLVCATLSALWTLYSRYG